MHEIGSNNFIKVVCNIQYMFKKMSSLIKVLHNKEIFSNFTYTFDQYWTAMKKIDQYFVHLPFAAITA